MKTVVRYAVLLLLVFVLAGSLAACGCQQTTDVKQVEETTKEVVVEPETPAPTPAPAPTPEPAPAETPVEETPAPVDTRSAKEKGLEAIMATGDHKLIQLPKDESYLDEFKTRYVDITREYGPTAPVLQSPSKFGSLPMPYTFQGATVTVVAEQANQSCILYRDSNNRMHAGWIKDAFLEDEYPGRSLAIGTENSSAKDTIAEVPMTWSGTGFLKSPQMYTVLKEPVENCVGFTLEYQVIAEGTDKGGSILGPRTVYVNNGTEWVEVGSFEYPSLGTVQVRVNLDEPMDIEAIGTLADCTQPNGFLFRQLATGFATAD